MPFDLKSVTSRMVLRLDNWAFYVFCLSTLFIVIFSVKAIHSWSPLVKSISILTACVLPVGIVILVQASNWFNIKKISKEILWVLLICVLGLTSVLVSNNQWPALKSVILFMASGPFIFLASLYLFKSTKNRNMFFWMASLGMLGLGFFGIYEYNYNNLEVGYRGILLFSENPLPAATLLILLFTGPMVLLSEEHSKSLKTVLCLSLIISFILIILLAKKGPIFGLVVAMLFLVFFSKLRYLKFFLSFVFLLGFLIQISNSTSKNYKTAIENKASVSVRIENYFFGLHVFKENPVLGIGYKGNVTQYLDDYEMRFDHDFGPIDYKRYVSNYRTYENIILTFMVELGGIFSMVYFGGIIYIMVVSLKQLRAFPQKGLTGLFIISVLVGFAAVSFTFDTLRYPHLNWLFHSLLGLLVNISSELAKPDFEAS
jgi:O-antigen ligase